MKKQKKLWGSAFKTAPLDSTINFTAGRDVHIVRPADEKLISYDILVNKVHCKMLANQKIISNSDYNAIITALDDYQSIINSKIKNNIYPLLDSNKEDVHSNIESWLTEKLGIEIAGKLHTARSRNDQIATDMRLFLKDQVTIFINNLYILIKTLSNVSDKYRDTIMPGFTHHQHANITTLGHTYHAFKNMFERDLKRFNNWYDLHNKSPLGGVASYGTTFNINRQSTAKDLNFDGIEPNSMDPIMNRWEAEADFAYMITIHLNHLSSLSQWLILFSTSQFNMIKLSDKHSTGSSIMPQKKNPDPLEVIKSKSNYISGLLQSLLGIGNANFIGYNRDSQWSKYIIMDIIDETIDAPTIMSDIINSLSINQSEMYKWCTKGFIGATALMEQISQKFNLPFRVSKILIETAIKYSKSKDHIDIISLTKAIKETNINIKISKEILDKWQKPDFILQNTKSQGSPGNY